MNKQALPTVSQSIQDVAATTASSRGSHLPLALLVAVLGLAAVIWVLTGCARAVPSTALLQPQTNPSQPVPSPASHRPEIDPYVTFLQTQRQSPVDYLIGLFSRYDIVIVSERAHPETTQYDLYYQLVSDKRFIDQASSIFMEIGTSTLQPEMDDLVLARADFSEAELARRIAHLGQNIGYYPFWEKTNYYDFIRKLYRLNRTLPEEKKIRVYPCNAPFSWEGMTPARYQDFMTETLPNRDRIMADQVIANFKQLVQSTEKRKKALVIMNSRHGFNNAILPDGSKGDNTGRYIMDQYPQVTANVMVNTPVLLPGATEEKPVVAPIQGGKWDAAFEALGNPNVGFDFKDTAFGRDSFDQYVFPAELYAQMKYQDMFTGFIFYKPQKEHILAAGVPGLYTWDEFVSILYPHAYIADPRLPAPGSAEARALLDSQEAHDLFSNLVTRKTYTYRNLDEYTSKFAGGFNVTNTASK